MENQSLFLSSGSAPETSCALKEAVRWTEAEAITMNDAPLHVPADHAETMPAAMIQSIVKAGLASQQTNVDRWADSLVSFLTLANGGGATAVLALLGASESFRGIPAIYVSLGLSLVGLAIVGSLWIAQGFRHEAYNRNLIGAARELNAGNMGAARMHVVKIATEDVTSSKAFAAARISFYCFVGACLSAGASALAWL